MVGTFSEKLSYIFQVIGTLILCVCLVVSCNPDEFDYLPDPDDSSLNLFKTDTFTIVTSTRSFDSIVVYPHHSESPVFLAGNYYDPIMGIHEAAVYSELRLNSGYPDFGEDPSLDSIVLAIDYRGFYGIDTNKTYHISIFELTEKLYSDTTYYQDAEVGYASQTIGQKSFMPNFNKSIYLFHDTTTAQLRVRLDHSFGKKILDENGTSMLADNDIFTDLVNGICVRFEENNLNDSEGLIYYFDLFSSTSGIFLYYNNIEEDSLYYRFVFSESGVSFSTFNHDYSGSETESVLDDSVLNLTTCYVQGMGGLYTGISIPYLAGWLDSGSILINKAQLILPVEVSSQESFSEISKLYLANFDDSNQTALINDYSFSSKYSVDGVFDEANMQYIFNISLFLQDYNNKNTDSDLILYAKDNAYIAERSIINGPLHSEDPMKLIITYTNLKTN